MAKRDLFLEAKIGLVMKLHKISRADAVAEIARMDAVRRVEDLRVRKSMPRGGNPSAALAPREEHEFMSAEEFFKGV